MRGRASLPFIERVAWSIGPTPVDTGATFDAAIAALPALSEPTPRGLRALIPDYLPGYDLSFDDLWSHSVAVAAMAEALAQRTGTVDPALAFRAGLFHDAGKLVLARHLAEYTELETALARGDMSFDEVELVLVGTDHAQIGGDVARHFGLEPAVAAAAAWHHAPFYTPDPELSPVVDLVHCADLLALSCGFARDHGERRRRPDPVSLYRLGETPASLHEASASGIRRLRELLGA